MQYKVLESVKSVLTYKEKEAAEASENTKKLTALIDMQCKVLEDVKSVLAEAVEGSFKSEI